MPARCSGAGTGTGLGHDRPLVLRRSSPLFTVTELAETSDCAHSPMDLDPVAMWRRIETFVTAPSVASAPGGRLTAASVRCGTSGREPAPRLRNTMEDNAYLSFDALLALARQTDAVTTDCACSAPTLDAWTSLPVSFPEQQLSELGTLVRDLYTEATFEEYHPQDTGLWSVEAPIAPRYYPCNRCTVWQCRTCGRVYLRYVEGGGYFVDPRIRRLRNRVLVDAPLSE